MGHRFAATGATKTCASDGAGVSWGRPRAGIGPSRSVGPRGCVTGSCPSSHRPPVEWPPPSRHDAGRPPPGIFASQVPSGGARPCQDGPRDTAGQGRCPGGRPLPRDRPSRLSLLPPRRRNRSQRKGIRAWTGACACGQRTRRTCRGRGPVPPGVLAAWSCHAAAPCLRIPVVGARVGPRGRRRAGCCPISHPPREGGVLALQGPEAEGDATGTASRWRRRPWGPAARAGSSPGAACRDLGAPYAPRRQRTCCATGTIAAR